MTGVKRVAVVTGGNRGIGFETCRQLAGHGFAVILAARDEPKGRAAAERLRAEGLEVEFAPLDVTDDASVGEFARLMKSSHGGVDVLVNNAGIMIDGEESDVRRAKIDTLRRTLEVNVFGALRVTQALLPLMTGKDARIVNVSSGLGQLSDMKGGWPAYRISKASLNVLTRVLANELEGTGLRVSSVCPVWVKTDMGGSRAPRTPQQGADTIVWLATARDVPSGGFFRDRKPIPW